MWKYAPLNFKLETPNFLKQICIKLEFFHYYFKKNKNMRIHKIPGSLSMVERIAQNNKPGWLYESRVTLPTLRLKYPISSRKPHILFCNSVTRRMGYLRYVFVTDERIIWSNTKSMIAIKMNVLKSLIKSNFRTFLRFPSIVSFFRTIASISGCYELSKYNNIHTTSPWNVLPAILKLYVTD